MRGRTVGYVGLLVFLALPAGVRAATLAGGSHHSLALRDDGTVWAWGDNRYGQLGNGSTELNLEPVEVGGLNGIVAIAAGADFSVALDEFGGVWVWGDNSAGQVAGSTAGYETRPVRVTRLEGVTAIAAGDRFVVAKREDDTVWTWGGLEKDGPKRLVSRPAPGPRLVGSGRDGRAVLTDVVDVAAGGERALALRADGSVWSWSVGGRPGPVLGGDGRTPLASVTAIAEGARSSYALLEGGSLLAWGDNSEGQLGDGTHINRELPGNVLDESGERVLSGIREVVAAGNHVLAITTDGDLLEWGAKQEGELGRGTAREFSTLPSKVIVDPSDPLAPTVATVGAGEHHSLAVLAGSPSTAWSWGSNDFGQLGSGSREPQGRPTQITASGFTWMARRPVAVPGSGLYPGEQSVQITSVTPGAEIRFTKGEQPLDPDLEDATLSAGEVVAVDEATTIKARAFADGLAPSPLLEARYGLEVAVPSATPPSGVYKAPQTVRLSTTTENASIFYTLDGSEPDGTSSLYVSPLQVGGATTLRARAFRPGWRASREFAATYRFDFGPLDPPIASPPGGSFETTVDVSLSSVPGATIRYTLDGSEPTAASGTYSRPVRLERTTELRARAIHPDWQPSSTIQGDYAIRVAAPEIDPPGGAPGPGSQVILHSATPGASIHYTLDGTEPRAQSPLASAGAIVVDHPAVVRARAFKEGCEPSAETDAVFDRAGRDESPLSCDVAHSAVAAGYQSSYLLEPDGTVWSWGDNTYGQLGSGTTSSQPQMTPIQVVGPGGVGFLTDIVAISSFGGGGGESGLHAVALDSMGVVWAWGRNTHGQLGDGTTSTRAAPVQAGGGLSDVVAIDAGTSFTLALKSDGTVWAWGDNQSGQLGNGTTTESHVPVQVRAANGGKGFLEDIVSIAAGGYHAVAVDSQGRVWAWGNNSQGQLGDGTLASPKTTPIQAQVSGVASVSAGSYHTLFLLAPRTAAASGSNGSGQLGIGTNSFHETPPVGVEDLAAINSTDASYASSIAVRLDGTVWNWGLGPLGNGGGSSSSRNLPGQVSDLPFIAKVALGSFFSLAIDDNCAVWVWGTNGRGQLGDGTTVERDEPFRVSGANFEWSVAAPTFSPPPGTYTNDPQYVALTSASSGASIRFTTDGTEPTSGSTLYSGPIPITGTTTIKARSFHSGMTDSDVVTGVFTMQVTYPYLSPPGGTFTSPTSVVIYNYTQDSLITYTTDGSEPTEQSTPYSGAFLVEQSETVKAKAFRSDRIPSLTVAKNFVISAGTEPAPAVNPGNGTFTSPQLATMTCSDPQATIHYTLDNSEPTEASDSYTGPVQVVHGQSSSQVNIKAKAYRAGYTPSARTWVTYTMKAADPVITPGPGTYEAGQRITVTSSTPDAVIYYTTNDANPTTSSRSINSSPALVVGNYTLKAMAVRSGCQNSAIAEVDYVVKGAVASTPSSGPAVSAGFAFSLGLAPDGHVWSWGANASGQLGDGTVLQRSQPVYVKSIDGTSTLEGVQKVSTGTSHALALLEDGTVVAWGSNDQGQLGNGGISASSLPVAVSVLTGVTAIASGTKHSVALEEDGTVWAWGWNEYGQLGQGTSSGKSTVPIQVKDPTGQSVLTGIVALAADGNYCLALRSDGTLLAWGGNGGGQLGDGTTSERDLPIVVPGLTGIQIISAGDESSSFAVDSDGLLWAWGQNRNGELGDGTATIRKSAVPVVGISGLVGIADDGDSGGHALAVLSDGTVSSWGLNGDGQLGDGTTATRFSPASIVDFGSVELADAGAHHSLALLSDGSVWAWGSNGSGQLGIGTAAGPFTVPVEVFAPDWSATVVAAPVISPLSKTSNTPITVTLTTATAGAEIRYTLDGTDPDPSAALYSGPFVVGQSAVLKARAYKVDLTPSGISSVTYELKVPLPSFSPLGGTHLSSVLVTVSDSQTGAEIHYTTDGVDPTLSDPVIASGGNLDLDSSLALKARAWIEGWTTSDVRSSAYVIKVAPPVLSPGPGTFTAPQVVTASSATPDAALHYTVNGVEPTEEGAVLPSGGVTLDRSMNFKVRAFKSGLTASDTVGGNYGFAFPQVSAPTLAPSPGAYTETQLVTLEDSDAEATIRFTLDGSDPDFRSRIYASPILVDADTEIRARAFSADSPPSDTTTGVYTLEVSSQAAAPVFSVTPGWYPTGQDLLLSSETSGAVVYYTLDGSDPTEASLTALPIHLDSSATVRARAFASGLTPSPVRRADYWLTGGIEAGLYCSLALRTDGTVWGWGRNNAGQLGDKSKVDRSTPAPVLGEKGVGLLSDVVEIATGSDFALALKRDGTVWHWGSWSSGHDERLVPSQVVFPGAPVIAAISAAGGLRTAVDESGQVWTWASFTATPVAVSGLSGVRDVSTGSSHRMALKTDGAATGVVWSWGSNGSGQIGDGTTATRSVPVSGLADVVSIKAKATFSAAVGADGSAWVWGDNFEGAVGNGTTTNQLFPLSPGLPSAVEDIANGGGMVLFLDTDGFVWASGGGDEGRLGNGDPGNHDTHWPIPAASGLDEVMATSAGYNHHTLAARQDLTVWSWGANAFGQLGDGSKLSRNTPGEVINGSSGEGFTLGDNAWLLADTDGDGLLNYREARIGTDILNADTNGDGISDGAEVAGGMDPLNLDMDGDGVPNAAERANGTDPFRADTDGDGVNDGQDCYPLDPGRSACPTGGDSNPPVITLEEPTNATLIPPSPPQ